MKWSLATISLLVCLGVSLALNCYECDIGTCNDPFNKAQANNTDCGSVNDACLKIKVGNFVQRQCTVSIGCLGALTGGPNSCKTTSISGVDTTTCCCTSALCNSANTRRVNYAVVSATLLLIKASF